MTTEAGMPDPGAGHLRRIGRVQLVLWPLGSLAWLLKGRNAALAFAAGGLASLAFWHLHAWAVGRMLTPSVRKRWFYGLLGFSKLALIALLLRGMMACLPGEALPLATGILLFVLAILVEAVRLVFHPEPGDAP